MVNRRKKKSSLYQAGKGKNKKALKNPSFNFRAVKPSKNTNVDSALSNKTFPF